MVDQKNKNKQLIPPTSERLQLPQSLGWEEVHPFPENPSKNSFVSGRPDSLMIRVHYFKNDALDQFEGKAWFGPLSEGPPGHAHGGSQAALLDEGMGAVAWFKGYTVLAAKLEINFRAPLPLGTVVTLHAQVDSVQGKKVFVQSKIVGEDGTLFSEGTGLFIQIDTEAFAKKLERKN